jgi:exopolysaccharide biosynthesis polyprenyl glycosylphosphotransferase
LGIVFFLKIFLLILPGFILVFALSGLYNLSSLRGRVQEVGKILVAVSGSLMLMILVDFLSSQPIFPSKLVAVYMYAFSLLSVTVGRQIVRVIQRALFRLGIGVYRTVIVGSGPIANKLVAGLGDTAKTGFKIVGAIDSAKGAQRRLGKIRVDRNLKNLINRLGGVELDGIMQADSALSQDEILELMQFATNHHLTYQFVPNQLGIFAAHSTITTMAGMPVVEMKRTPLEGWGRIVKRGFDFAAAGLGLLVLSPVLAVVAVAIWLNDPGPIIYRHRRLSRTGRYFRVYKFRTMKWKYCTGAARPYQTDAQVFAALGRPELVDEFARNQKLVQDPRVGRLGAFLRKTSLDELPQLLNVLLGQMSLVGPRPIVQAELDRYGAEQSKLLALRPGLTGLWQISGRSSIGYDERIKLDVYYIENWNFWLDIRIILRTLGILLNGRGAY